MLVLGSEKCVPNFQQLIVRAEILPALTVLCFIFQFGMRYYRHSACGDSARLPRSEEGDKTTRDYMRRVTKKCDLLMS